MDNRYKKIEGITLIGAGCNLLLFGLKLFAGIFGRSAAMVADAIHSLSDLVSDVVVALFSIISSKGKDKGHDYGHGKFETLAALCVSIILVVVGARMMVVSIREISIVFQGGDIETPHTIALWMAFVSIVVKELLYQWTVRVGRKVNSPAVIANAWHHRTDALSSVASLIGIGAAILLGGKWAVLDPIAAALISIFIIAIAVKMAMPALGELTDASLADEDERKIKDIITSVDGVKNVHELKTRQCGRYFVAEAHIVVSPSLTVLQAHDITVLIEERLRKVFGAEMQITIHVEPSEDSL